MGGGQVALTNKVEAGVHVNLSGTQYKVVDVQATTVVTTTSTNTTSLSVKYPSSFYMTYDTATSGRFTTWAGTGSASYRLLGNRSGAYNNSYSRIDIWRTDHHSVNFRRSNNVQSRLTFIGVTIKTTQSSAHTGNINDWDYLYANNTSSFYVVPCKFDMENSRASYSYFHSNISRVTTAYTTSLGYRYTVGTVGQYGTTSGSFTFTINKTSLTVDTTTSVNTTIETTY